MKKIISKWYIVLFGIILIAAFLRFFRLDSIPPSMYWDEVSQGYNSYSILKTGKDEHQEFLPIARFQAFGDYKAPVYIYLDVPFIGLFGKTALAVRFPSALFGTLTVLFTFFLVRELFSIGKASPANHSNSSKNSGRSMKDYNFPVLLGLLASFFLAISPWHIQLSRVAYEGNIATFFTVLGACLFFVSIRRNMWWFPAAVVAFVVAFYSFNAHRVFIPLLVLLFSAVFWKTLWDNKKRVLIAGILGIVLLLPYISFFRSPESKLRFAEVNIFTDLEVVQQANEWQAANQNNPAAKLIHNRRVLYGFSYVKHYLDFFNPNYLFIHGDINPRFSSRDVGQLYLWQLPLFLFGLYALTRQNKKVAVVIFGWFLLAPIAAATARETPHALRSETFIPTYEIFCALGFLLILKLCARFKYLPRIAWGVLGIAVVVYLYIFLHNYYVHFSEQYSGEFQYGYKQAIEYAQKVEKDYDRIVVTRGYGRPYIYALFYSDITPEEFWKTGKIRRDQYGFYDVDSVGKYVFRDNLIQKEDIDKNVLYIGREHEIPDSVHIIEKVPFVKGDTAFVIAKND